MSKNCTICKHYGRQTPSTEKLEKATLFNEEETVVIHLCRSHSVDLFKNGQKNFLLAHHKILQEVVSSDSPDFLELLEKVFKENYHELY